MIVVSDTSPLNYLVLVHAEHVLPELYGRVIVPTAVRDELASDGAPPTLRLWARSLPVWLEVRQAPDHTAPDQIHAGEAEAIALAKALHASLLLMDDQPARHYAETSGLRVTGTLGVLRDAGREGLVDLRRVFDELKRTNFRASPHLLETILFGSTGG